PVFSAIALIACGLALWAATTPAGSSAEPPAGRQVAAAILSRPVLLAFWLVALPSLFAGTFDVLVPLRLDELGAGGVAIGAVFLVAAAIEAVASRAIGALSDRRGRMLPIRIGLAAAVAAALLLPLPGLVALLALALIAAVLATGFMWAPAMALLSDSAEARNLDLAFASALVSLSWAGGQVIGGSAGPRLADATSDALTYAVIAALFALTLAALLRGRASGGGETNGPVGGLALHEADAADRDRVGARGAAGRGELG
ncbi:MAG: MFS transporter, partial [Solirubrobacterales bacterium]